MIKYSQTETYPVNNVIITLYGHEYEITSFLKESVEWNKVMSVIVSFQSDFNDYAGRFLKSTLVHNAIERYSNHRLKYIDEIGCDFFAKEKNARLEFKGGLKIFQHRVGKTVAIKLKNFNGNPTKFTKTFDYLVLCDGNSVGVVSYENITPHIFEKSDGIYCKIPHKVIEFFIETNSVKNTNIRLTDFQQKIIDIALDEIDQAHAV